MATVRMTQELLADEMVDATGYVDSNADAAALRARFERQVRALALLPEGCYVERRDYEPMGRKRGHEFDAFHGDGTLIRVAGASRIRHSKGDQAVNLGPTYGGADECEATCKAVCLLLAAIDYEAHARKPEVT